MKYKIKEPLKARLNELGVTTDIELNILRERVLSTVSARQAQLNALNSQIDTLTRERDELVAEITSANITINKLLEVDTDPVEEPIKEPVEEPVKTDQVK
jgi:peptidoglycan hydrolase CwlO-like protein